MPLTSPQTNAAAAAARAAAFVIEHVRALAGPRWSQGERRPALPFATDDPSVRAIATIRMYKITDPPARALAAWSRGERDVDLLDHVPTTTELLALQAQGRRCVSLLTRAEDTGVHETPLDFALHDLCHLEKFVDPASHAAQVGFFEHLHKAWITPAMAELHARYDDAWQADLAHVAADMNGSPVFLVAALKMKLKMAERRALARDDGRPAPTGGPLTDAEIQAFAAKLEHLFAALGFEGDLLRAARAVSTRRDAEADARVLHTALEAEGEAILAAKRAASSVAAESVTSAATHSAT